MRCEMVTHECSLKYCFHSHLKYFTLSNFHLDLANRFFNFGLSWMTLCVRFDVCLDSFAWAIVLLLIKSYFYSGQIECVLIRLGSVSTFFRSFVGPSLSSFFRSFVSLVLLACLEFCFAIFMECKSLRQAFNVWARHLIRFISIAIRITEVLSGRFSLLNERNHFRCSLWLSEIFLWEKKIKFFLFFAVSLKIAFRWLE